MWAIMKRNRPRFIIYLIDTNFPKGVDYLVLLFFQLPLVLFRKGEYQCNEIMLKRCVSAGQK